MEAHLKLSHSWAVVEDRKVATLETHIPLVQVRVEWLSPDCHFWEFHTCLPIVGARRARASTIR